jgi:hypothetical protein
MLSKSGGTIVRYIGAEVDWTVTGIGVGVLKCLGSWFIRSEI